jgi:phosphoribosylaminoimidazolecarboxamide formyltransferase/IMP cyclohydrolase
MNTTSTPVKRALISVSNKAGVIEFARRLVKLNIEIISSGGTSKALREANISVRDVSEITEFPEMMDGRVKTLHPRIHGGILGLRDEHALVAKQHQIGWIDLVIVNLYPFAETIQNPSATFDDAVENIDIGGPTLIRAAAKNMGWVGVVVDPVDYDKIATELESAQTLSLKTRETLAAKAFGHTAEYDAMIYHYLTKNISATGATYPEKLTINLDKQADLRYGENPHQTACAYRFAEKQTGILSARQHQGKQLSYNNIADADAACACLREFTQPTCVIVKHANPCGVASDEKIEQAFQRAFYADAMSAFGGVVALNRLCDTPIAEALAKIFVEVVIAPGFTPDALRILSAKPNLRVLELNALQEISQYEYKSIEGGLLVQDKDTHQLSPEEFKIVTTTQPTPAAKDAMLFAWRVLKHIKSNAILLATHDTTVGVGAGQVSRIDSVETALRKAGPNVAGTVLASDAFFPFRDSIDRIANTGIRAIIQPGGSVKDEEVINACNEHGIAMVFTGKRCFKH